jgi:hypothetical protein
LLYGTVGYADTKSEIPGGGCTSSGRSTSIRPDHTESHVWDARSGFEWRFDHDASWLFASTGARSDVRDDGSPFYGEARVEYDFTKSLGRPFAVELAGKHRLRRLDGENLTGSISGGTASRPWREGEHYTSLKIAPKWSVSQGFEYTTLAGFPTYYVNGSVAYRFSGQSDVVRVFVGQQRGGLRCVNGICKVFPPFEGARAELTLRF